MDLVARRRLRGVRPAIERRDPDAPDHPRDPLAADHDALDTQRIAQHPAARERVVEMPLVDPPHDHRIGRRHWPGPLAEAASAQLQDRRLPNQGEIVLALDHRFALSTPVLPSAPAC
jgi:hypothetical protein